MNASLPSGTPPAPREPAPGLRPLSICVDDLGLHPAITRSVVELAGLGHISATSAMTQMPHWPEAAQALAPVRDRLDVGLHFNLTEASPQGAGMPLGTLIRQAVLRQLDQAALATAFERQLEDFASVWGGLPDHIDGHQHVHQFPVLREALIEVLSRRYASSQRPWLRVAHVVCKPWELKARIINAMGARALRTLAERHGLPHSQHLSGVYDFMGDTERYRRQLQAWLGQLAPATVLMCHPAQGLNTEAPFPQARLREQDVLSHPALDALLNERHIRIVRGSRLFARPSRPAPL